MRFIFFLAILSTFFTGCIPKETELEAKAACAKVTNQNWRESFWQVNMSSQEQCVIRYYDIDRAGKLRPCNFGGMPFMCDIQPDGAVIVRRSQLSTVLRIDGSNRESTKAHLEIIE